MTESTELAKRDSGLDVAAQRERLPELVEAGDAEGLANVAHMAKLVQLHERAMENKAKADEAGRLRIEADAGIGVIDIKVNPRWNKNVTFAPLVIGTEEVPGPRRNKYRLFGYADLQGILGPSLDRIIQAGVEVHPSSAAFAARSEGAGWWRTEELAQAYATTKDYGRCIAISRESGVSLPTVQSVVHRRFKTIGYEMGLALADAMGVPRENLRPYIRNQPKRRVNKKANARSKKWAQWDMAMRSKGGEVAKMYAQVRRVEQMGTGARAALETNDARADLDSAILDLQEAAAKLHHAALLG